MRVFMGLSLAVLALPPAALGDIIMPTAQDRFVAADALAESPEENDSQSAFEFAPDFNPWVKSVSANAGTGAGGSTGSGDQNSQMLADRIFASGASGANAEFIPSGQASSSGGSFFDVTFTITEEHSFLLDGLLFADPVTPDPLASASVELLEVGVGTIYFASVTANGLLPVLHTGVFQPGDYELIVSSNASAQDGAQASSSYDIRLIVPEPDSAALLALGALGLIRRR